MRMQARKTLQDATAVIDISTSTSGIEITDATAGVFEITLDSAATSALDFKKAVYDLEIEFSGGEVRRILEGIIELRKEVTR